MKDVMNLIYLGWVYVAILTGGGYAHVTCDHYVKNLSTHPSDGNAV